MRHAILFDCGADCLAGTLDKAAGQTGLLIISGGNEIRAGAYGGQAAMAATFAALGYPTFRYDRRGVGDSEGENGGFESSSDDIAAALSAFKKAVPHVTRIVAFGNCDAASALALFHNDLAIDALILANPWVIEDALRTDAISAVRSEGQSAPSAAAIRARYWARIKNPRSIFDLLSGKIDIKKLAYGIMKAAKKNAHGNLSARIAMALTKSSLPVFIVIAKRDTTALEFMSAWSGNGYSAVRRKANITLSNIDTASHSFSDAASKAWLIDQILGKLEDKSI